MAARGRSQHEIDQCTKGRLKVIEHTVTTYHRWTAHTAAAQHNGEMVPDHDKQENRVHAKAKKKTHALPIPNDQRILNRIEYAKQSHGMANVMTVESQPRYGQRQSTQPTAKARIAAIRGRLGNTQQDAMRNDLPTQVCRKIGDTVIDQNIYHGDRMPRSYTSGHELWVAGNSENFWIWCTRCGAYTNKSVRKLNRECTGKGCMSAANQLSQGYEPFNNTHNAGVTPDKPDESLIHLHFAKPAATDLECRNLIWAIYWKVRREASVTRRKIWPDIVQGYNCRVVRGRRVTQNNAKKAIAQMRDDIKHHKNLELTEEVRTNRVMLATPLGPAHGLILVAARVKLTHLQMHRSDRKHTCAMCCAP